MTSIMSAAHINQLPLTPHYLMHSTYTSSTLPFQRTNYASWSKIANGTNKVAIYYDVSGLLHLFGAFHSQISISLFNLSVSVVVEMPNQLFAFHPRLPSYWMPLYKEEILQEEAFTTRTTKTLKQITNLTGRNGILQNRNLLSCCSSLLCRMCTEQTSSEETNYTRTGARTSAAGGD